MLIAVWGSELTFPSAPLPNEEAVMKTNYFSRFGMSLVIGAVALLATSGVANAQGRGDRQPRQKDKDSQPQAQSQQPQRQSRQNNSQQQQGQQQRQVQDQ